jgi:hypothetical protein
MLNIPEAPGVQSFEANWLGAPIGFSGHEVQRHGGVLSEVLDIGRHFEIGRRPESTVSIGQPHINGVTGCRTDRDRPTGNYPRSFGREKDKYVTFISLLEFESPRLT